MNKKLCLLTLLCIAMLIPSIANAQDLSVWEAQKVVIADIIDRNDRPINPRIKDLIIQGYRDNISNSADYELYEVNINDVHNRIKAKGLTVNFANICKELQKQAHYIIFTTIKSSSSAIGNQSSNVTIFISTSLYRINTATEVLADQDKTEANEQSILSVSSALISRMLGIKNNTYSHQSQQTRQSYQQNYQNSAVDLYNKGVELYKNENYSSAITYFKQAAEQGHAEAQNHLGVCYANGRGVAQDYYEAVKWYRKAAEQGDAKAQNNLGYNYANGRGVAQDYYEAVKWFRKAAEQGNAKAQHNLGFSYEHGRGVPQDYYEAAKWYRKAAEQGHAKAKENLQRLGEY